MLPSVQVRGEAGEGGRGRRTGSSLASRGEGRHRTARIFARATYQRSVQLAACSTEQGAEPMTLRQSERFERIQSGLSVV